MATQTRYRVVERPLDVVLLPDSPAEAAYESAVLAPGFQSEPGLDLRYLGGKTMPTLTFMNVYLGTWDAAERTQLDQAIAAAMADPNLNNVLAQYFLDGTVRSRFGGSLSHLGPVPPRVYRDVVEAVVAEIHTSGALTGLDLGASAINLLLPEGAVLVDGNTGDGGEPVDSTHGLGGYHGSVHVQGKGGQDEAVYYAVAVYSKDSNGIVAFAEPWKNVCATLYHELCEIRTDPDVEDAIRAGTTPEAERLLGWYSARGGEIGDVPMAESHGKVELVMKEVPLADGSGTVPIQLMWSNAVDGPEGPISLPHAGR
jgi:hypothetical protein